MNREYEAITDILKNQYIFSEFNDGLISRLALDFELLSLEPGDTLYTENDPADCFYLLTSGTMKLSVTQGKRWLKYATLTAGDYFGEECLGKGNRADRAFASGDVEILRLPKERLESLLATHARLERSLRITSKSRKLARNKRFKWLD